jgi:hypothetical protein
VLHPEFAFLYGGHLHDSEGIKSALIYLLQKGHFITDPTGTIQVSLRAMDNRKAWAFKRFAEAHNVWLNRSYTLQREENDEDFTATTETLQVVAPEPTNGLQDGAAAAPGA